jgi:hypothetical protein
MALSSTSGRATNFAPHLRQAFLNTGPPTFVPSAFAPSHMPTTLGGITRVAHFGHLAGGYDLSIRFRRLIHLARDPNLYLPARAESISCSSAGRSVGWSAMVRPFGEHVKMWDKVKGPLLLPQASSPKDGNGIQLQLSAENRHPNKLCNPPRNFPRYVGERWARSRCQGHERRRHLESQRPLCVRPYSESQRISPLHPRPGEP